MCYTCCILGQFLPNIIYLVTAIQMTYKSIVESNDSVAVASVLNCVINVKQKTEAILFRISGKSGISLLGRRALSYFKSFVKDWGFLFADDFKFGKQIESIVKPSFNSCVFL